MLIAHVSDVHVGAAHHRAGAAPRMVRFDAWRLHGRINSEPAKPT